MISADYERVRTAIAWRIRKLVGDDRLDRAIVRTAWAWRPLLRTPLFIGITGSAGKTTTKELLLGILSQTGSATGTRASLNVFPEVAKTILRTRPIHDYCVVELSEDRPGSMDLPLALVRPVIGIVTVSGSDHQAAFSSADGISAEIEKLVRHLPPSGTAILNADDDKVLAMAARCPARVITYGTSPVAQLRATEISADWPDRLELTVSYGNEHARVRTRLCGSHFVASVLGAIGGGLASGLSINQCAEKISSVAPIAGRMQPVTTADGVTFIRDDFKAPLWSIGACFEFMQTARAERKIIVIGELQECSPKGLQYAKTARLAQEIADVVVFVGPWSSSALKARQPGTEKVLITFGHLSEAAGYINSITRTGDLVLLKGSAKQDHLLRIVLSRSEAIACWRDDCERPIFCDQCSHRGRASGMPASAPASPDAAVAHDAPGFRIDPGEQIIVGLGNPEAHYSGTPHNVGYEVVDSLAGTLGLTWDKLPEAWIARGTLNGQPITLFKVHRPMNLTGAGLKQIAQRMPFSPEQCILVFDDMELPLGSVRVRLKGGAGGHRGVSSILEAFQSDAFRRVKIGVGKPGEKLDRVKYVLTVLDDAARVLIDKAIVDAGTRILRLTSEYLSDLGRRS